MSNEDLDGMLLKFYRDLSDSESREKRKQETMNRELWTMLIDLILSIRSLDDYDGVSPVKAKALAYAERMRLLLGG